MRRRTWVVRTGVLVADALTTESLGSTVDVASAQFESSAGQSPRTHGSARIGVIEQVTHQLTVAGGWARSHSAPLCPTPRAVCAPSSARPLLCGPPLRPPRSPTASSPCQEPVTIITLTLSPGFALPMLPQSWITAYLHPLGRLLRTLSLIHIPNDSELAVLAWLLPPLPVRGTTSRRVP